MDNLKKIISIVEDSHSKSDFQYHILPVVQNALLLTEKLNADKQIVEVAAYIHDLGRTKKQMGEYESENDHHIIGEKICRNILTEMDYDKEFIEKVAHCVLTHRGRKGPDPKTLEAQIVNNADAMAHFDMFLGLFLVFANETTESFAEAVKEVKAKIQRDWEIKLTLSEAKEIVKPKYEAAILLLDSTEKYLK